MNILRRAMTREAGVAKISYRRFSIGLLMGLALSLGTTHVARADSTSNCNLNGSGSSGTTNCSVVLDSNNFANARVNPITESVGAEVGSSSTFGLDSSNATHNDTFACTTAHPCQAVPPSPGTILSIPVTFTFRLDGTASATSNFMGLSASYQVLPGLGAAGGQFNFNFDEDPGKGPSADVSATASFSPADGSTKIPVPVALTQDANGNFQFSVDYTTAATPLCSPSCPVFLGSSGGGVPPQVDVFNDSQSIATQLEGDGTPQFLDAFNTFSVGITSLDPNFQPASIDGRTLNIETSTTPEPSSVLLLASGLVALFLVSWAHRV